MNLDFLGRRGALGRVGLLLLALIALAGCQSAETPTPTIVVPPLSQPQITPTGASAEVLPPNPTPIATVAAVALQPTPTLGVPPSPTTLVIPPTPLPTPTTDPLSLPPGDLACSQRMGDDLMTVVTKTYGLSGDYAPTDLVPLSDYLPQHVTLGYPTEVRQIMVEPLVQMVTDMQTTGLQVWVMSGYRSYAAQSIAYNKWVEKYPDRADILSARPGHSEHQLGTTVDFGTPELEAIVGPGFEFHTYFYKTQVGIWLAENAHRYGFTLSFPLEATEITGFYYEPWHYRYVGVEAATRLKEMGLSLTEFGLANQPQPCVP